MDRRQLITTSCRRRPVRIVAFSNADRAEAARIAKAAAAAGPLDGL